MGFEDLIQKLQDETLPVGRVLAEDGPTSEPRILHTNLKVNFETLGWMTVQFLRLFEIPRQSFSISRADLIDGL